MNSSYLLGFEEQPGPGTPSADVVNTVFNPADLRLRGGIGWRRNGVGANLFVNHVSGYEDNRVDPSLPIASWTTLDFSFSMNIGEVTGNSTLARTQLFASALNVLDKLPPFVADSAIDGFNLNFDPENHDIDGRSFSVGMSHRW